MSEYIRITTDDLARSIDEVSEGVSGTTYAVNEMQSRLCAAEREAADKVSRSVSTGFFFLIKTQLAQNKVKVQSIAESQLLALRHLAQSLRRIQKQMGVDFERISLRYSRLFKTLADALHSRVYALDRPAAEVVEGNCATLDRRVMTLGAPAAIVQQDAVSAGVELETVRCKTAFNNVLGAAKTLVEYGMALNRDMDSIVRDVPQAEPGSVAMPVLVVETTDLFLAGSTQTDIVLSRENPHASTADKVKGVCHELLGAIPWSPASEESRAAVGAKVRKLLAGDKSNNRVKELVVKMLAASKWQSVETAQ